MIPLTFLCDEYIDRPKLSVQKNEYIVPPPHKWGRNNKINCRQKVTGLMHSQLGSCACFLKNRNEISRQRDKKNEFKKSITYALGCNIIGWRENAL